jgi:NAD(P)-dependent dehydrogenase (short-subunit alcohol dehydrogenase family)
MISGAASARGIGLATVRLFPRHGAKVVILDLDEVTAAAAASIGPDHRGYGCTNISSGKLSEEQTASIAAGIPLNRLGNAEAGRGDGRADDSQVIRSDHALNGTEPAARS